MPGSALGRTWPVTILVWLTTGLILFGFVRIERDLEKRSSLQYLHDGSANAWQLDIARVIGGSGSEVVRSVARAPSGDIYALVRADANMFGPGGPAGQQDIFVLRLDGVTGELDGQASIGGTSNEDGTALRVEPDGDVLIAGTTESVDFPAVRLVEGSAIDGQLASFIVRFSPDLSAVRRNVLLSGDGHITIRDILLGDDGGVYAVGSSSAVDFPATPGAWQTSPSPRQDPMEVDYGADGFLLLLDESLLNIRAATLFGGERDDYPYVLRRRTDGVLMIAGNTASADYPVTHDPEVPGGNGAARSSLFITQFEPGLARMGPSVVWGSDTSDLLRGMDIDAEGRVHICGHTNSHFFPLSADAAGQAHSGGHYDMVYGRLSPDLSAVEYSTYLGGGNNDFCSGIAIMEGDEVIVAGDTNSTELLGGTGAYPGSGLRGSFLARVGPGGTAIVAALKAFDASVVNDMREDAGGLLLAGFSSAVVDGGGFEREVMPSVPGGRDGLLLRIARPGNSVPGEGAL